MKINDDKLIFGLSISIPILLIGLAYLSIQNRECKKMQEYLVKNADELINEYSVYSTYVNNRMHEFNMNGTLICSDFYVSDANSIQYKLIDVIPENALVLRYSTANCSTCIEQQIEILKSHMELLNFDNIIFLSNYESNLFMGRYLKINNIKYKTYNMSDELTRQIIDIGMPYYFVINKYDLRINKMFVPLKENPALTEKYLKSVMSQYFN